MSKQNNRRLYVFEYIYSGDDFLFGNLKDIELYKIEFKKI